MSTEADPEIDDAFFMDDAILSTPTPQLTPQPTTNINTYTQSPSRFLTLFPTKHRVSSTEAPSDYPTLKPTAQPSKTLSNVPSQAPSFKPSPAPSPNPTFQPSTLPSINTGTRTYLSCPAPAPKTFEGIDKDGNTVVIQLDQPVSTIPVGFIFEVTKSSSSSSRSIEDYLPDMQSELGGSLASYLQEHTENENENETSTSCDGYSVETMTRHLQEYDGQAEDTKILSVTSSSPFTVSDQACTTPSPSCSVVEGSYDVTYVGTNEAAVETVIYKAMMEEVENLPPNNDFEAEVSYSHQHDDGHIRLPPVIQKIGNDFMDAVPESEEGFLPNTTIYGKIFLGLLGGAFLMIIFVVFRSSDKGKKDKDEDDEDKDGEDVSEEGSNSDTCSDGLEDVVIDDGSFDCEQQVVDGNASPDDSAMTPRISNTAATADILADLERSDGEDEVGTEEGNDALASLFTELEENTESVEIDLQSTLS